VAYVAFGVDVEVGTEENLGVGGGAIPLPASQRELFEELGRAKGDLQQILRDEVGIELPASPDQRVVEGQITGRPRTRGDVMVLPGRTRTALLLGDGGLDHVLGEQLDPSTWLGSGRDLTGTLWAGFGVVLDIEKDFPVHQVPTNPSPQFAGPRRIVPEVPEGFWSAAGEAVIAAAADVALPPWPLQHASLRSWSADMSVGRHWQSPDGVQLE